MSDSATQIIERELAKCVQGLLSHYSTQAENEIAVELAPLPELNDDSLECSSISLTGEEFRLSIVLVAATATVTKLCPIKGASAADWIGEMANQLVGRLKNALIDYGHAGRLSLPVTLSCSSIRFWNETECPLHFIVRTSSGPLVLRLEAEIKPDSVWVFNEDTCAAAEGSMCLF